MKVLQLVVQGTFRTTLVMGVLAVLSQAAAEATAARAAKDAGERAKAVTTATRYLQGAGFVDPMLAAENVNDSLLTVDLDFKRWVQMDKNQKNDFLERLNSASLTATGGVSIDIHVSVNGSKVAASAFSGGQQFLHLTP